MTWFRTIVSRKRSSVVNVSGSSSRKEYPSTEKYAHSQVITCATQVMESVPTSQFIRDLSLARVTALQARPLICVYTLR